MNTKERLSLCRRCSACPEVEVLVEAGQLVTVRIGEGTERVTLPKEAWNTLVGYIRDGVVTTL